jgi:hypothetical protein
MWAPASGNTKFIFWVWWNVPDNEKIPFHRELFMDPSNGALVNTFWHELLKHHGRGKLMNDKINNFFSRRALLKSIAAPL